MQLCKRANICTGCIMLAQRDLFWVQSSHTVRKIITISSIMVIFLYQKCHQGAWSSFCAETEALGLSCCIVAHHITSVFLLFTGLPDECLVSDSGWHATLAATGREAWCFWDLQPESFVSAFKALKAAHPTWLCTSCRGLPQKFQMLHALNKM